MPEPSAGPLRRVLVVAYYFPPMAMSGVQRTAKFVKYLPDHGWEPTVLTVQPGSYWAFDPALESELVDRDIRIVRTGSVDPTRWVPRRRTAGMPPEGRRRRLSWLSQLVFVPDNKIGWYPSAVRAGRRLVRETRFDAVFSSAPPYTGHLVAQRIARSGGLPFVTDFRDDWLGNPRHVYPTPLHRRMQASLERRTMQAASAAISINDRIGRALAERTGRAVETIPQGYDPEDYPPSPSRPSVDRLRLVYTGVFYDAQTPIPFLQGLRRYLDRNGSVPIQARFVGLFPEDGHRVVEELGLDGHVTVDPYLPNREAMRAVSEADVAWLTVGRQEGGEQISTGKLYAYMGAAKPILGLVPEGAAADRLRAYGASWIAPPDDEEAIADALEIIAARWKEGNLPSPDTAFVELFDRRVLTGRLAAVLNRVVAAHAAS